MKTWVHLMVLWLLAVASLPVAGESILERRYTSAKLDGFWRNTLGMQAPDADWFELLAPGPEAVEPVSDALPELDFGVPFFGEVLGESAAPQGEAVVKAFPVIPLSREAAAELNRRLAWAEIYLNRYRYFEAVGTDTAETYETLTSRQYAAGLEAYLITARLYFAAADLPGKCLRLQRMDELAQSALSGLQEMSPPQDWRPLVPIQQATANRLGDDALAGLVCSVQPVRGRAETIRVVETRVRERIMLEVRAKVEETLHLLEASSTEFQRLVNDMDVPILSAEILELERVLGNASANMILVKEDQLKAADTIAELQDVDLSSLNQPGQLSEFEQGQTRMTAMVELIEEVMSAMAKLSEVSGDPEIVAQVAPCANLRGAYSALDLSRDTGELARQINGPYEDCIARARSVVARFQEPSLDKALMAEFARHVRQISETYLSTVAP